MISAPGHVRLVDGADRPHAVPDRGALLGAGADEQPGLVGERHDRQVERRAQVGQPGHRLGALDGQAAPGHVRVTGHHADRMTVQAGQRGHDRPAVTLHLHHRAGVEHRAQDVPDPVGLAPVPRYGGQQPLVPPPGRIVAPAITGGSW